MKKFFKSLLVALILIVSGAIFVACGDEAPTKIEIVHQSVTTTYNYNQEISLDGLQVVATYRDGTQKTYTFAENSNIKVDVSAYKKDTPGEYKIVVSLNGIAASFNVTVRDPQVVGFEVDTQNFKANLAWNEDVDLSKLKVYSVDEVGAKVELSAGTGEENYSATIDGFAKNVTGTYTLRVTYKNFAAQTFDVVVGEAPVVSIALNTDAVRTSLFTSELFSYEGLVVTATLQDGNTKILTDDYSIDFSAVAEALESGTVGEQQVVVTYTADDEVAPQSFVVTIKEPPIANSVRIEADLETENVKTEFAWGDPFSYAGLKVKLVFADGTTKVDVNRTEQLKVNKTTGAMEVYNGTDELQENEVLIDYVNWVVDYSAYNKNVAGEYTIKITHQVLNGLTEAGAPTYVESFETTYTVVVAAPKECGFTYEYKNFGLITGSRFNINDVKVYAVFEDGSKQLLDSGEYRITIDNQTPAGDIVLADTTTQPHVVVITYKNYDTQQFHISVGAAMFDDVNNAQIKVVFKDLTYQFGSGTIVSFADQAENSQTMFTPGNNGVTQTSFKISIPGLYLLRYTDNNGNEQTQLFRVVENVVAFEFRDDFLAMVSAKGSAGTNSPTGLLAGAGQDAYQIGTGDQFKFDVALTARSINSNNVSSYAEVKATEQLVTYTFYYLDNENWVEMPATFATIEDDLITFATHVHIGEQDVETSTLTLKAKLHLNYSISQEDDLELEFKLNDGVNVFNCDQLKVAFGNRNVHQINIHREILAEYDDSQLNPNGTPKNIRQTLVNSHVEYDDANGKITTNNTGNVFVRIMQENDSLTVNGNYFEINASKLALLETNEGLNYADQEEYQNSVTDPNHEVVNSQTAVFRVRFEHEEETGYGDTYEGLTTEVNAEDLLWDEQTASKMHKDDLIFNNVIIRGNTQEPTGDNSANNVATVLKNSGGLIGIRADGVDLEVNNSVLYFCLMGVVMNGRGADLNINKTHINRSWANSIYGWRCGTVVATDCLIEVSGGAGISFDDSDARGGKFHNPNLKLVNTAIENYVAGTENWFVVNGLTVVKPLMTEIETGIRALSSNNALQLIGQEPRAKSVITLGTNITTGAQSEVFNFAVLMRDTFGNQDFLDAKGVASDHSAAISMSTITIGEATVQRYYEEMDTDANPHDPRVGAGMFGTIDGENASMIDFLTRVGQIAAAASIDTTTAAQLALAENIVTSQTNYVEIRQSLAQAGTVRAFIGFHDVY